MNRRKIPKKIASEPITALRAALAEPRKPSPAATRMLGIQVIEAVISPGAPCIGLQLFAAGEGLFNSFRRPEFAVLDPVMIGIPAILSVLPGISQQRLADLMGLHRAPAGVHVRRCMQAGLVRREAAPDDARKYCLYLTAKGAGFLEQLRQVIPAHEAHCFGKLSAQEQKQLYGLLIKLVSAQEEQEPLHLPPKRRAPGTHT